MCFVVAARHLLVNHADPEAAAAEVIERWESGDLRLDATPNRRTE